MSSEFFTALGGVEVKVLEKIKRKQGGEKGRGKEGMSGIKEG